MIFTKEQLIAKAREQIAFCRYTKITGEGRTHVYQCSALFEIALAALTAPAEPVYQYRIRNGYNGQVTEWQTIRRDQVDFVLKTQPHNAEFQIIAPPAPVVDEDLLHMAASAIDDLLSNKDRSGSGVWAHVPAKLHRATMLQGKAEPACTCPSGDGYLRWPCSVHPSEPVSQREELQDDTRRLDWLDTQNKRLNDYYGTTYGWKFDANFQRNAMMLNDSNYPVMTVRQAIDEAIAAAPQQEV